MRIRSSLRWLRPLILCPLGVLLVSAPAGAEPLCAFRAESGAIVYTNTPSKDGSCAAASEAPPLDPASRSAVSRYDRTVRSTADRYGVSSRLVHAVIAAESAYNPSAVSSKGAKGLMQLLPSTARLYGATDLFNPEENVRAGVAHLRGLLDRFGGDTRLAVAAYNAGEEAVRRYRGVPPYRETRQYVSRVLGRMGGRTAGTVRRSAEKRAAAPIEVVSGADGTIAWVN